MSLSFNNRESVRRRAENKSEILPLEFFTYPKLPLECSHLSHARALQEYDAPEMAMLCTVIEHYAYHDLMGKNAETLYILGLSDEQNEWSKKELKRRILDWAAANSITIGTIKKLIEQAKTAWFYHLGIEP